MDKIIIGNRTEDPAYFDLIVQHPINGCKGFQRVGDRASIYIKCLEWRVANPNRKLIILDMPRAHNETLSTFVATECPSEWIFRDIADEIWLVTSPGEILPKPNAEGLHDETMWAWWFDFNKRKGNQTLQPLIKPTIDSFEVAEVIMNRWNLSKYITIQPLFDAPYAEYRNKPIEYWQTLISNLASRTSLPIVVLGHIKNALLMGTPAKVYPAWSLNLTIMESLALIYNSFLHIGGETGTTIWSSIFGVDTYGIYSSIKYEDKWFTEPISFGGKVCINMTDDPISTANDINFLLS